MTPSELYTEWRRGPLSTWNCSAIILEHADSVASIEAWLEPFRRSLIESDKRVLVFFERAARGRVQAVKNGEPLVEVGGGVLKEPPGIEETLAAWVESLSGVSTSLQDPLELDTAPKNRTYLDTETTGLDPERNEIIEIAFVVEEVSEDVRGVGKIVDSWYSKIRPVHIGSAHPKALEVNGYTPEAWGGAPTFAEVLPIVRGYLDRATCLVGHNPGFDARFIEEAFWREGQKVRIPYHRIDTVTSAFMAWNWTAVDDAKLKLDALRERLGLPVHPHHSALQDALDCRRVLYAARSALTGIGYPPEL